VVAQLKHVRIILSQNGDCVTLLPDHQPRLLLVGIAKVDSIKLEMGVTHQTQKGNGKPQLDISWKCARCCTSRSWSPYSKLAWCAMLPAVTLDTNTPPFSPLTMEIPSGSAPFCTMTLRGSSKYGLQGNKRGLCFTIDAKTSVVNHEDCNMQL